MARAALGERDVAQAREAGRALTMDAVFAAARALMHELARASLIPPIGTRERRRWPVLAVDQF